MILAWNSPEEYTLGLTTLGSEAGDGTGLVQKRIWTSVHHRPPGGTIAGVSSIEQVPPFKNIPDLEIHISHLLANQINLPCT